MFYNETFSKKNREFIGNNANEYKILYHLTSKTRKITDT